MRKTDAEGFGSEHGGGEELQPPHLGGSEQASNGEQVLGPERPTGPRDDEESDPTVAERFAREAEDRSVGRG